MAKGFKATALHTDGTRQSIGCNKNHRLLYDFDVPTFPEPGAGPLACFRTEVAALAFLDIITPASTIEGVVAYLIFPCTYKRSNDKYVWYSDHPDSGANSLYNLPRDTVLASSITIHKTMPNLWTHKAKR